MYIYQDLNAACYNPNMASGSTRTNKSRHMENTAMTMHCQILDMPTPRTKYTLPNENEKKVIRATLISYNIPIHKDQFTSSGN